MVPCQFETSNETKAIRPRGAVSRNLQSHGIEYALDVQVHDLGKRTIRMCVKLLPPSCAGVGK